MSDVVEQGGLAEDPLPAAGLYTAFNCGRCATQLIRISGMVAAL